MNPLYDNLMEYPLISGVYSVDNIETILDSPSKNIFLLDGNIFNLKDISTKVKSKEKSLYICVDSIDGFSKDTWGLEYMVKNVELDGIISSKSSIVKMSMDMGVFTIQRTIIYNTRTLITTLNSLKSIRPHAIELLPGLLSDIIKRINQETKLPVIASGLINRDMEVDLCLDSGAIGVCTSNIELLNNYKGLDKL